MALDPNKNTLEQQKFAETTSGNTAVRVISDVSSPIHTAPSNTSYIGGTVTCTNTQTECKVGVSNLANRKMLYIENQTGTQIFYGPTGVTTGTGARLANNQAVFLSVGPAISVFVIKASGSGTVIVQEFA